MKRLKILGVMILALSLILIGLGATEAPAQEVFNWKVQTAWGTELLYYKIAQDFCDRVKAMSKGRLNLSLLPVGAISPPFASLDALSKGVFEAHLSAPVYWAGKIPVTSFLLQLPFGLTDYWQYEVWYYKLGGIEIAREAYAPHNAYFIGIFTASGSEEPLHMKKQYPIRTVEDFKGRKLRVAPGMQTDIMAKLGAATVHLPGTEVYTALERGVIDGAKVFGRTANWGFGIHEVTHWITLTGLQTVTCLEFVANRGAWDKLPADLKAILEAANREHSSESFARLHMADMEITGKWLKLGKEIVQFPESELAKLRRIAMPVWEQWAAKDALSKKAFESQKAYMQQLGL